MEIAIPSITNPGVAFTENTYEIMQRIECYFKKRSLGDCQISYKNFQHMYMEEDPTGDSKIRMIFPLFRKAGCIYPDDKGHVVFMDGTFLTPLGIMFHKASHLYYELMKLTPQERVQQDARLQFLVEKVRKLYSEISKQVFLNLSESISGYKHLFQFILEYGPVTKDEISLLLYSLEKTSSVRGKINDTSYVKSEIDALVVEFRNQNLTLRFDKVNNAANYFLNILRSLLLIEEVEGGVIVTQGSKMLFE